MGLLSQSACFHYSFQGIKRTIIQATRITVSQSAPVVLNHLPVTGNPGNARAINIDLFLMRPSTKVGAAFICLFGVEHDVAFTIKKSTGELRQVVVPCPVTMVAGIECSYLPLRIETCGFRPHDALTKLVG